MDSFPPRFTRISADPQTMNGQPCIRGTRLTVRRVLQLLAIYSDRDELRHEFPELTDDDLREALEFAAARLEDRVIELEPGH